MIIEGNKLLFFDDLYYQARDFQKIPRDTYDKLRGQYESDKNNALNGGEPYKAMRPLSYEMIEAQVSTQIPPIKVTPERFCMGRARNAITLEKTIHQDLVKAHIDVLNDEDERNTYIYGTSIWLIEWDDTIRKHGEVGAPVIALVRPDKFIPQPAVSSVQRMEYCFLDFDTTVQEAARKYEVDEEDIRRAHTPPEGDKDGYVGDEDSIVVHVCYYRNAENKISQYVWTDMLELLDFEDIYSRKRTVCRICGRSGKLSEDGETCACGGDLIEKAAEYEELTKDVILDAGNVVKERRVIPAVSPIIRNGKLVMKKVQKTVMTNGRPLEETVNGVPMPLTVEGYEPKMEPTRIPWYTPSLFPIVARKNTSTEASIFGQSDLEYIRGIQDEYNKIKSRVHDKLHGATVFPVYPERAQVKADNSINQKAVRLPEGTTANQFGVIDTSVSIIQDLKYLETLYEEAKRTLGITDSFMGQSDTTAKSGRAKQIQVAQAAGRLASKRKMKEAAYAEVANIIFQYRLAYSDEPIPVRMTDEYGMVHFSAFNRYDYVEYDDKTGEWYYDDSYLFETDAVANVENDPETTWQSILNSFQAGMYGPTGDLQTMLRVWMMLQKAHYPFATEQVQYLQALVMQQQAMANMQTVQQGQNIGPEV